MALIELARGMGVTFKNLFRPPTTVRYPEERRKLPERTRGRHVLHRYENGLERCIGCYLCAGACPADCIYIEAEENTPENRVSAGERYARVYEIDELRCIFCGFCEEACPTGAITLEPILDFSDYQRGPLIYTKDMLLEPPRTFSPAARSSAGHASQ